MVRDMTVEPGQHDGALTITYRGLAVVLTVSSPPAGAEAVTEADVLEALESAPPATIRVPQLREAVRHASGVPTPVGDVDRSSTCDVVAGHNGLAVYAIPPAPPPPEPRKPRPSRAAAELLEETGEGEDGEAETDPRIVSEAWLRERVEELGVTHGILGDVVREFEPARVLGSVCCIARGQPPRKGRDTEITLTFETEAHREPAAREDGGVDFRANLSEQFVETDTVLARRQPEREGRESKGVFGRDVPPPRVQDRPLEQMVGPNTEVRGEELVAVETGRPVLARQRVSVLQVIEVPGDLDYSVGNIGFSGDMVVRGDVLPGFTIEAGGSVSVSGVTEGASIQAGQDLTLGGVVGGHDTVLKAGGDLVARFLHNANVEVDGEVRVQGEVVNCQIRAQRVVTDPKGRIVGGDGQRSPRGGRRHAGVAARGRDTGVRAGRRQRGDPGAADGLPGGERPCGTRDLATRGGSPGSVVLGRSRDRGEVERLRGCAGVGETARGGGRAESAAHGGRRRCARGLKRPRHRRAPVDRSCVAFTRQRQRGQSSRTARRRSRTQWNADRSRTNTIAAPPA